MFIAFSMGIALIIIRPAIIIKLFLNVPCIRCASVVSPAKECDLGLIDNC